MRKCPTAHRASTSGIRAAEEAGAAKVPQASLHLQLAKEELELANGLAEKGKKEEASSMLLRAEADAELAVVLSHGMPRSRRPWQQWSVCANSGKTTNNPTMTPRRL